MHMHMHYILYYNYALRHFMSILNGKELRVKYLNNKMYNYYFGALYLRVRDPQTKMKVDVGQRVPMLLLALLPMPYYCMSKC